MYCQTKKADYSKIICLDAIETVEYTWHLEETFLTVQNGLKLNLVTAYLLRSLKTSVFDFHRPFRDHFVPFHPKETILLPHRS